MSASQEKKKRQELYASGQLEKDKSKKKAGKAKVWVLSIVCVLLVALVVTFFGLLGTGFYEKHATAVTVGSSKVSPAIFNYFYYSARQNVNSQFGELIDYVIDSSKPLDEQYYNKAENITWADYFRDETLKTLQETYAVYNDAVANGFVLDETAQSSIDAEISTLDLYASYGGYSSAASFLTSVYGKGCNQENYREFLEVARTAEAYRTERSEQLQYSDEEVQSYYEGNRTALDTVSFRSFLCKVESDETDDEGNAIVDMDASKKMAEEMEAGVRGDEQRFIELSYENASDAMKSYYEDDDFTLTSDRTYDVTIESLRDWLFDDARQPGDTTVLPSEGNGYYVAYFVDDSSKFDVNMIDVRHILIAPEADEDAETDDNGDPVLTEENWDAAKAEAEGLYKQWQSGDKTEDSFADLATEHSSDTASAANGGLMEDVYPGQTVGPFNDWCFDAVRKTGDTGIVRTEYGYHILYFVSADGENYQHHRIVDAMRTDDMSQWVDGLVAAQEVHVSKFGMRFTKL